MPASDLPSLPSSRLAIFVEGIDGAGKSELCLRLYRRLRYQYADGARRVTSRGWPADEALRARPPADPVGRARAHLADFRAHLRLGTERSQAVQLHDRGPWSTIACQDPPEDLRRELLDLVAGPRVIHVLLDVDPAIAAARRARRGRDADAEARDLVAERERYRSLGYRSSLAVWVAAQDSAEEVEAMAWEGIRTFWEAMSAAPARS
jgi:thymidylate kinase